MALVKAAFGTQEPGHGGQWSPATLETRALDRQQMEEQQAEADRLRAEIDNNKRREKIPGGSDAANLRLQLDLDEKLNQIEAKRHSLAEIDAVASPEARAGRAYAAMPKPEEFGPNLPPYIDREAERGHAYESLRRPEEFGPAAPATSTPAPVAPQVDPSSATDALFTLGSLSEETGAKMQTALSVTAKPNVDTGDITAATAAVDVLIAKLGQVGAMASAAAAAVAGAAAGGANASVGARRSFNPAPAGPRYSA